VAILAAASAGGVAEATLQGGQTQTAAAGAGGAVVTLSAGVIAWARRHRGTHRVDPATVRGAAGSTSSQSPASAQTPQIIARPGFALGPDSVAAAMSAPPVPVQPAMSWAPPATVAPSLFLVPRIQPVQPVQPTQPAATMRPFAQGAESSAWVPDPMVDTVPHPVVKLFPLAALEPDRAAGTIDDRVYAAIDAERELAEAARLAGGRHASAAPTDAAAPRSASYRSRHSA
jgi:hypothetical protein